MLDPQTTFMRHRGEQQRKKRLAGHYYECQESERQEFQRPTLFPSLVVVLLIQTDAKGRNERHVYTRRNLHAVRLLIEEDVFATEDLAVDACDNKACFTLRCCHVQVKSFQHTALRLINDISVCVEEVTLHDEGFLLSTLRGKRRSCLASEYCREKGQQLLQQQKNKVEVILCIRE